MSSRRLITLTLAASLFASGWSCVPTKAQRRYTRQEASQTLSRLEKVGLTIGEFPIDGANAVIDGDTVRVKGLSSSMRLLALDTEETFKKASEREAYARGWDSYKKAMRADASRPVKLATPLGEDAKHWGQAFFEDVTVVRLERDHPGEIRDYYGRYLAYAFAFKNGQWVNYNVESVRAGMSPYFTKYGRSRRFDKEFREAQKQAQEARVGIWDPNKRHYDDYEERLKWWDKRAEVITRFEKEAEDDPRFVILTRWNAMQELVQHVGQEVVILGSVNELKLGDEGPTVVKLGRSRGNDFDVVFWDKDVAMASGVLQAKGEYVRIKGVVRKYTNRHTNADKLQIQVTLPGQVLAPSPQLDQLLAGDDEAAPYGDEDESTMDGESLADSAHTQTDARTLPPDSQGGAKKKFRTPPPLPAEDEPD